MYFTSKQLLVSIPRSTQDRTNPVCVDIPLFWIHSRNSAQLDFKPQEHMFTSAPFLNPTSTETVCTNVDDHGNSYAQPPFALYPAQLSHRFSACLLQNIIAYTSFHGDKTAYFSPTIRSQKIPTQISDHKRSSYSHHAPHIITQWRHPCEPWA